MKSITNLIKKFQSSIFAKYLRKVWFFIVIFIAVFFYSYHQFATLRTERESGNSVPLSSIDVNETPSSEDENMSAEEFMEAIKKAESTFPPRIGEFPTEEEINNSPYIQHIRLALNSYLDGTNTGVEETALNVTDKPDWGLNNFDKSYYKGKFVIVDASDNEYGGVQADIVFVDNPDTVFWAWVYRLGGDGEYVLRGFSKRGPPKGDAIEFWDYIEKSIKNAKYFY